MKFLLTINCDNEAFDQPAGQFDETARILRAIADRLDTVRRDPRNYDYNYEGGEGGWTGHYQTVRDSNGNDVGRYAFKEEA